jgi:hypothetical protein
MSYGFFFFLVLIVIAAIIFYACVKRNAEQTQQSPSSISPSQPISSPNTPTVPTYPAAQTGDIPIAVEVTQHVPEAWVVPDIPEAVVAGKPQPSAPPLPTETDIPYYP